MAENDERAADRPTADVTADLSPADRARRALQRRNHELAILNAIAKALNGEAGLDQALQTALVQTIELLDLETGWVWLLHEETDEPYLAAAHDLPPALAEHPGRMTGGCYCLDTFRAGDLTGAANLNVVTCSRLKWLRGGTRGLRYHASVPLYAHGASMGVLNVASTDWQELSQAQLRLLHTVGDMVGIAVERARLFEHSVQLGAAEERNRLAREIHDTLAQDLSAIALQLETADALIEGEASPSRAQAAVRRALALTRQGLEAARRSVMDLRAAPLEGRTLADALAALVRETDAATEAAVTLAVTGGARPLSAHVSRALYRMATEALKNAARHASAEQIEVVLTVGADQLRLAVTDDGRGFDPAAVEEGRFGLVGLRERARLLGADIVVESAPGQGTRIAVTLPLDGAAPSDHAPSGTANTEATDH